MRDRFDVVGGGAGAAGSAALRRLGERGIDAVALEAGHRIGGRAHTVMTSAGFPVDCGPGWVHSADENVLAKPIERAGFALDRTPPHWMKQAFNKDFSAAYQRAYRAAFDAFDARVETAAKTGIDRPASDLFEPGNRWNP